MAISNHFAKSNQIEGSKLTAWPIEFGARFCFESKRIPKNRTANILSSSRVLCLCKLAQVICKQIYSTSNGTYLARRLNRNCAFVSSSCPLVPICCFWLRSYRLRLRNFSGLQTAYCCCLLIATRPTQQLAASDCATAY